MTTKADYTPEEWQLISEGPMTAGMMVITAEGGGTFRETFALAKAYTEARKQHGESELLDEIVSAKPEFDRHKYHTNEDLHIKGLQQLAGIADLLREKATPEELADYREFTVSLASTVAAAHKEHGEKVSANEQARIDEIRAKLE